MTTAGWYHAYGDPPNTTRYWDGTQWVGAVVAGTPQTTGGYDLIPVAESPQPRAHSPHSTLVDAVAAREPTATAATSPGSGWSAVSCGYWGAVLGVILGIFVFQSVAFHSPTVEETGTITHVDFYRSRRGVGFGRAVNYLIDITTDSSVWHVRSRLSGIDPYTRADFTSGAEMEVTVSYSSRTGTLVAVEELGIDHRPFGRVIWPTAVVLGIGAAAVMILLFMQGIGGLSRVVVFLATLVVVGGPVGFVAFDVLQDDWQRSSVESRATQVLRADAAASDPV